MTSGNRKNTIHFTKIYGRILKAAWVGVQIERKFAS